MLKLAQHIVESKEGEFEPDSFVDHYEEALIEIIKKKQSHEPLRKSAAREQAPRNVINLMDALRRSVQGDKAKSPAKAVSSKAAGKKAKKNEGQREMLLPISGKKGKEAKDVAKEGAKPAARRKAG
jgi:DNA end-binding protein Ku